ncbi:helix-turn-helix transcriptional regulator, partial [Chloroflexota bacterium]
MFCVLHNKRPDIPSLEISYDSTNESSICVSRTKTSIYIYGERTKFFRPKVNVSTKTSKPQVSSQLPIRQAIANAFNSKRILKIQYRNASGYVAEREIDILALGNNYIDAYDHLKNEPRTFKIDRIFKSS